MAILTNLAHNKWLSSFVNEVNTKKVERIEGRLNFEIKYTSYFSKMPFFFKKSNGDSNIDNLFKLKSNIDKILIKDSILTVFKEVKNNFNIKTIGVDYNNNNIFFWIELKSDSIHQENQLKKILEQKNKTLNKASISLRYIIVSESIGLELPPDYVNIKIYNGH